MLSEEDFMKGMALLMANWPEQQVTEITIDLFRTAFKDFNAKDWERVIKAHIYTNRWWPRVADLREELVRLRGFNRPTATDAWDSLVRAAESGQEPEMDENTCRALRVCGGWDAFSRITYKELPFFRKDFERVYNEGLDRTDRQVKIGWQGPEQRQIEGPV